jgi:hypothetical protein
MIGLGLFFLIFLQKYPLYLEASTFEEIIFLLERCIVKKKTYLCECPAREMVGNIRKRFLLYPKYRNRQFQQKG